jgi:hypothetical protein
MVVAAGLAYTGASLGAWGPDGHHMVARLAVSALPADAPPFLRSASERLQFLNYEPDFWRDPVEERLSPALRQGHDPDHHFKLERFGPGPLPPDRYAFLEWAAREHKDPRYIGVLPYRAMELFQRMRVAFRRWRQERDPATRADLEARIVDDAGILGHYIGDAAQPLHTTIHNNGWVLPDNPRGFTRDNTIHLRFEHEFVHSRMIDDRVRPLMSAARIIDDPLTAIHQELRRASEQVIRVYELEQAAPFGPASTAAASESFVAARLADGATILRDLWYTAYRTSAGSVQ